MFLKVSHRRDSPIDTYQEPGTIKCFSLRVFNSQLAALHGVNVNKHDVAVAQEVERVVAEWWLVKEVVSSRLAAIFVLVCPKAAMAMTV